MPKPTLKEVRSELRSLANPEIAEHSQGFFKTGPGEYGEGDKFIGVRVPELRRIAKKYRELSLANVNKLLHSPIHEERLLALLMMVLKYQKGDEGTQQQIYDAYCDNMDCVNNWDLVDCSAHWIVGDHLRDRSRRPLYRLAGSKVLWERRIAMMATLAFIRENDFDDALKLADKLLHDREDLIHKMVGWMIREIGKRDLATAERFLKDRYETMLRYAIERFPKAKRDRYMGK